VPDTQQMLDRGYSVSEIRRMLAGFRSLSPTARLNQSCASLLKGPALDACNHQRTA